MSKVYGYICGHCRHPIESEGLHCAACSQPIHNHCAAAQECSAGGKQRSGSASPTAKSQMRGRTMAILGAFILVIFMVGVVRQMVAKPIDVGQLGSEAVGAVLGFALLLLGIVHWAGGDSSNQDRSR